MNLILFEGVVFIKTHILVFMNKDFIFFTKQKFISEEASRG